MSIVDVSLQDLVAAIDAALYRSDAHQLLRIVGDPPEISRRPLDVDHPLDALLGFTAPDGWTAVGLHCSGSAFSVEEPSAEPLDVVFTFLLDRSGNGAGVMRAGQTVTPLPGPPQGFVGDACHRILGLPTPPPPDDTVDLWLRTWLDRLVDSVAFLGHAGRFRSWDAVAALHPVATFAADCPIGAPIALADATRRLAEAWPWSRLRKEPEVADTPEPPLSRQITEWMDDGMYARWTLGGLPTIEVLAEAVTDLVPTAVTAAIIETVMATGVRWPAGVS